LHIHTVGSHGDIIDESGYLRDAYILASGEWVLVPQHRARPRSPTNRGGDYYASNSSGPIVVDGVVLAGSTCQVAGFGCYVTAHDARTGEELWRNTLIPRPGQPRDETWAGSPFESRWMTGVWGQLTYDPELDLVYYGSSGVGPASEAQRNMPGATMAGTDTRFAVKPKTGEIIWKHQVLPRDNWDQECTYEMMVINTPVNPDVSAAGMLSVNPDARRGPRKTLTGVPCKTGIAWSFDAANGEFLWAKATNEQNLVEKIDGKGLVTVNESVVLKEVGKDVSRVSNLHGRARLAQRRLQSEKQHHVCPTAESLLRYDGAH
jgi:alcohol dehydrogenase (cytochrome c)